MENIGRIPVIILSCLPGNTAILPSIPAATVLISHPRDASFDLIADQLEVFEGSSDLVVIHNFGSPEHIVDLLVNKDGAAPFQSRFHLLQCITVVNSPTFSKDIVSSTPKLPPVIEDSNEDEAIDNIAKLLITQLELATSIYVGKQNKKEGFIDLIKAFNHRASIIDSIRVGCVFKESSYEETLRNDDFVRFDQLMGKTSVGHTYQYKARRPFHPRRLHDFIFKHFHLEEPGHNDEQHHCRDENNAAVRKAIEAAEEANRAAETLHQLLLGSEHSAGHTALIQAAAAAAHSSALASQAVVTLLHTETSIHPHGCNEILRSRGFVWLAGRDDIFGVWDQISSSLTLTPGGPWYSVLPERYWPEGMKESIMKDFEGSNGDRRQELLIITMEPAQHDQLKKDLDACLLRENEGIQGDALFKPWPTWKEIITREKDDGCQQTEEVVVEVTDGGRELQSFLDATGRAIVVVHWLAPWCKPSVQGGEFMAQLAQDAVNTADVLFLTVNVEGSIPNSALAYEKVLEHSGSRRPEAKPVLKEGLKFPCFTVHAPPSLEPVAKFTDVQASAQLKELVDTNSIAREDEGRSVMPAVLEGGAAQFKELLSSARNAHAKAILVWHGKDDDAPLLSHLSLLSSPRCLIMSARADVSKANSVLSEAFKVKELPTLQIFEDMKLVNKISGLSQCMELLRGLQTSASIVEKERGPMEKDSTTRDQMQGEHVSSEYDPPQGKFAKPGTLKRMSNGQLGHFFPKMPCLRCGCPWWSSEEWDARCLRCGWDCEQTGYDDESKPLPKFKTAWERFTAQIREGRTPPWSK